MLLLSKGLRYFHMNEFANPNSSLRKLLGSDNDARQFFDELTGLIQCTSKSFAFAVDVSEYDEVIKKIDKNLRSSYGTAYTFLGDAFVHFCRKWARSQGYRKQINFVFGSGAHTKQLIGSREKLQAYSGPPLIGEYGIDDACNQPPIQAADILAYVLGRKYNHNPIYAGRLPKGVAFKYLDRDDIKSRMEEVQRIQERARWRKRREKDQRRDRRGNTQEEEG